MVGAHDLVGDPDLAHVVRLGGGRVGGNNVLDGQGKDLAGGVAGEGRGRLARQHKHDGARDVGHDVGRDPGVVFGVVGGGGVVVWLRGLELSLGIVVLSRAGGTLAGVGALPLLWFFIPFECECLDHVDLPGAVQMARCPGPAASRVVAGERGTLQDRALTVHNNYGAAAAERYR